ncbi:AI-2E family transporter [Cellulomonas hominis]
MAPEDGTRWMMLGLWYGVYMLLEAYVVAPRVIGRSVELPGVVILLVTLLGAALWGILGALVAVPVAVALGVARTELSARRAPRRHAP